MSFFLLSLSRFFSFLFVSFALLQPTHVLVGLKLAPELLCLRDLRAFRERKNGVRTEREREKQSRQMKKRAAMGSRRAEFPSSLLFSFQFTSSQNSSRSTAHDWMFLSAWR